MPTFTYVARTRDGKRETGKLTAENRQVLIRTLQGKGMVPERVDAVGAEKKAGRDPKVKTSELLVFTRQLSTIVNAGLPLLQGLDILSEQSEDPRYAAVIQGIANDVEAGETFSDALRKHPRIYSVSLSA